jgi:hypothetical protein
MDSLLFSLAVDLGDDSTLSIGESSSSPTWYTSADPDGLLWGANVVGFMVTTNPSTYVLRNSWILESKFGYIDTSSMMTFVPTSYWSFVMDEILSSSIGYYFDTDLDTYVLSCDQYRIMENLYIRFDD